MFDLPNRYVNTEIRNKDQSKADNVIKYVCDVKYVIVTQNEIHNMSTDSSLQTLVLSPKMCSANACIGTTNACIGSYTDWAS